MNPHRIQRKRTKGWKMPENTIYVGRGSRWGNPFQVLQAITGKWIVITKSEDPQMQELILAFCNPEYDTRKAAAKDAIRCYAEYLLPFRHGDDMDSFLLTSATMDTIRQHLSGKNLACWCKEGESCHADCLLMIANPNNQTARPA